MSPNVFVDVLIALAVLSVLLILVTLWMKGTKKADSLFKVFFRTMVASIVLAMFSIFLSWHIPGETMLITSTGEVKGVFPEYTKVWRWDSRFDETEWVSYAKRDESVKMSVSPVMLTYEVTVEILGSPESYLVLQEVTEGKGIKHWLMYQSYEFNKAYGRDLAKFSNPLDEDQQNEFEEMVRSFLSSRSPPSPLSPPLGFLSATAHYVFKEARFDLP